LVFLRRGPAQHAFAADWPWPALFFSRPGGQRLKRSVGRTRQIALNDRLAAAIWFRLLIPFFTLRGTSAAGFTEQSRRCLCSNGSEEQILQRGFEGIVQTMVRRNWRQSRNRRLIGAALLLCCASLSAFVAGIATFILQKRSAVVGLAPARLGPTCVCSRLAMASAKFVEPGGQPLKRGVGRARQIDLSNHSAKAIGFRLLIPLRNRFLTSSAGLPNKVADLCSNEVEETAAPTRH
jgi:hypothetical protein